MLWYSVQYCYYYYYYYYYYYSPGRRPHTSKKHLKSLLLSASSCWSWWETHALLFLQLVEKHALLQSSPTLRWYVWRNRRSWQQYKCNYAHRKYTCRGRYKTRDIQYMALQYKGGVKYMINTNSKGFFTIGSDEGILYYWGPTEGFFTLGGIARSPILEVGGKNTLSYSQSANQESTN